MSTPSRFRHLRKFLGPRWLTEEEGEKVGYSLDLTLDGFIERLRQGLYARLPQNDPRGATTAPTDALEAMGRDRRVVRGIDETDASYAARLRLWLDDRHRAGNPYMLMQKLAEYVGIESGVAFRTVDARGNWYSRDETGAESALIREDNWDWDGEPERWSRFWVIVYPYGFWVASSNWGDSTWGVANATIGTTATPEHVAKMRFLVNDWKGAGRRCEGIIIALDPASFDPSSPEPDGLWGRWSKTVNGVRVPSRLSTARYWQGSS